MDRSDLLGNIILLIVGGNDTTRDSMTGSVLASEREFKSVREATLRAFTARQFCSRRSFAWQTPLAHMRRTALQDTELGGNSIKEGDRVVMVVRGDRDSEVIENTDELALSIALAASARCRSASEFIVA